MPPDFEALHTQIYNEVRPFTMTSPERVFGLIEAVRYISRNKIEGDIAECGVWKGGSMLAIAKTLLNMNDGVRKLFLYDTFSGMSTPTDADKDPGNKSAADLLKKSDVKTSDVWAYSGLNEVKTTMSLSGYQQELIHYVEGKVEDTIPGTMPGKLALLRLDTDWYESTRHELVHLFPLLVPGAVLIIDDYGFWKGARKAVDEYIAENNIRILLNRMDDTGRIAIRQ
ncbi:MAG TPA: TylF/MycF/NovP-related O-methyltransferase [Chitinophagaceae bacterium]